MGKPPALSRALDESVTALADAIEVYYRSSASNGTSSVEVREALSRAMRWMSEASRLDFEQRRASEAESVREVALDDAAWKPRVSGMR